jgi:outer membrane protein assembly factor BamB
MLKILTAAAVAFGAVQPTVAGAQSVVTYHNAPDRAGLYTVPGLSPAIAAKMHLDAGFNATVSGSVYAQPLYWQPTGSSAGLVIVAAETNAVYALNANTGAVVWQTSLAPPAPLSTLGCGNIDPEGVTGTPVIDPASSTLYLDAMTLQGGAPRQMLYALSLTDGKILPNWPLNVQKAMSARHAAFDSKVQGDRSALQFFGGNLYMAYAGRYGDCGPYRGTVIEVSPAGTPAIVGSWATRAHGGGIWAQGGVSSDGTSLFATTGNTFSGDTWVDGEAIIRLAPGLAHSKNKADYFTPANWKTLDNQDLDLGGTQALPLDVPTPPSGAAPRMLALGKDGNAYLVDRANLGGIGGALAILHVSNTVIITEPAVYSSATATLVAFTNYSGVGQCGGNGITMLKVKPGSVSVAWCAAFSGGGAPIVTTTNGSANPIVWVVGAEGDNQLHGFDAWNGETVFGGGPSLSGLRHLGTILAANGHLYVAADGTVYAFTFKD